MDDLPPEHVNASNAGRIVGVVGVFHLFALTFVSLRIYARLFILRAFGAEDALIIVAVIPYGLGRHGLTIPTEDRIDFERITFWKTVLSDGVAMGLLRISMAISLLRLKKDLNWYRWSLYALIGDLAFCH
ncbi:Integral membrane protein [Colletotrichum higginsianum IMI 349063]|uniref:Integral membrane protein n=1 Tax=Colletotrichum higginsianum (strain IMI 349063) TaxID=759273 RepID=A0A1B7XYE4_COLHI|nr:Integral membrane protein [Colletotrichum higginsianum IMI 349063]OBR04797.1 Integral membrane protein [Colletotrichum higginsianum IMI 349063]